MYSCTKVFNKCGVVNGENIPSNVRMSFYAFISTQYIYYAHRLQLFINFEHFNCETVLIYTIEHYLILWLVPVLAYFSTCSFATVLHYVINPLIICSFINA